MKWLRVNPLDVFCARGNKLFGEAGSFGGVGMPPWPSLMAGALRSKIISANKIDPRDLLLGRLTGDMAQILGNGITTGKILEDGKQEFAVLPGDFRIVWVSLERKGEIITPLPLDLVFREPGGDRAQFLTPLERAEGVKSSAPLSRMLTFRSRASFKAETGYWLEQDGLCRYLAGEIPRSEQVLREGNIWATEERVGIGMDSSARSVETGKLFTTEAVRLLGDIGFLVGVEGADTILPVSGFLRLGGDGRGAWIEEIELIDLPGRFDFEEVARTGRFRLILSTPGLFANGWLPFGVNPHDYTLEWSIDGLQMSARLVAAATGRLEVVSGWDLAREQPKPAQRVVPAWSVYWFDEARGSVREILEEVLIGGLWAIARPLWDVKSYEPSAILWKERRAEGFNNVLVGLWPKE